MSGTFRKQYGERGKAFALETTAAGLERYKSARARRLRADEATKNRHDRLRAEVPALVRQLEMRDNEVARLREQVGRLRLAALEHEQDNDLLRGVISRGAVPGWSIVKGHGLARVPVSGKGSA